MNRLLLLLAVLVSFAANAMKIVTDEIDEFTSDRTVITSWESFDKTRVYIRFRLQSGKEYLDFKFRNGSAIVIAEDSPLMFKGSDGEITKFMPTRLFTGGEGDGSIGANGSGVWGISATYIGDINWFNEHCPTLMRIYSTEVYNDKKFSDKEGTKLQQLTTLFLDTVNSK